jgi:hypothetical protein
MRAASGGCAVDRGDRRAPTGSPMPAMAMKRRFKDREARRMLRTLHRRWPCRRLCYPEDPRSAIQVRSSRCRLRRGRSYARPNLDDARQNRPHTDRSDVDEGL